MYAANASWADSRAVGAGPPHAVDRGPHLVEGAEASEGRGPVLADRVVLAGDLVVQGGDGGVGLGPGRGRVGHVELEPAGEAEHVDEGEVALVLQGADEAGVADGGGGQVGLAHDPGGGPGVGGRADAGNDDQREEGNRQRAGDLGADRYAADHQRLRFLSMSEHSPAPDPSTPRVPDRPAQRAGRRRTTPVIDLRRPISGFYGLQISPRTIARGQVTFVTVPTCAAWGFGRSVNRPSRPRRWG